MNYYINRIRSANATSNEGVSVPKEVVTQSDETSKGEVTEYSYAEYDEAASRILRESFAETTKALDTLQSGQETLINGQETLIKGQETIGEKVDATLKMVNALVATSPHATKYLEKENQANDKRSSVRSRVPSSASKANLPPLSAVKERQVKSKAGNVMHIILALLKLCKYYDHRHIFIYHIHSSLIATRGPLMYVSFFNLSMTNFVIPPGGSNKFSSHFFPCSLITLIRL